MIQYLWQKDNNYRGGHMKEAQERINWLRKKLEEANYNYYVLDNPTITDQEFDKYLREL